MKKKRLSEAKFQKAIRKVDIGPQTIQIAHGVLVDGRPQADFVALLGISKGAVSQAVNRVWQASIVPDGFERVTAILPKRQSKIVRGWETKSREK